MEAFVRGLENFKDKIFKDICHFLYGFDEWKRITKQVSS